MASVEETTEMVQFTKKEVEILDTLKLVEGSNLWSITLRRMR